MAKNAASLSFNSIPFEECQAGGWPTSNPPYKIGPILQRFCGGWDVNCTHSHANRPQALPANRQLPLHHLQLLQASTLLQTDTAKDTTQRILEQTRRQQRLCIAAYVLMPEHIHLLTDEPAIGTLASFLQIFKQLTSRELKTADQRQFWQRRYYDFTLLRNESRRSDTSIGIPSREVSSPDLRATAGAASTTTLLVSLDQ
jgi:REP element-mobilizing transposase RayT